MDSDMTDLIDTDTVAVHLDAWGQILSINVDQLDFTLGETGQAVAVGNDGAGTLYWDIDVSYLSGDNWLSLSPGNGDATTLDEDTVVVTVTPTGTDEDALILVNGYMDSDMTDLIDTDTVAVHMAEWHSGTGEFLIEMEKLFLVADSGMADTIMIFYHNIGNGSFLLTDIVSNEPEIFYYDTAFVSLPQVMHPGMGWGVGLIVNPISGSGTFTGELTFMLQNANSDNYVLNFFIEVFPMGEVTTNTTMLDSVTTGGYDLTDELMVSLNITDLDVGNDLNIFIQFVDGTPPPVNASGDTSVVVAPRYWEIERFGAGNATFDICFDLSVMGTEQLLSGVSDFNSLKIFKRASFSADSLVILPIEELQYDEANNTICATAQTELSQWTVGGDSSGTNFMPAFPQIYNLPVEDMVVPENQDLSLSADVVCEAGVKEVQLNYLIGGDPTVNTRVCSELGSDTYGFTIDKQDVTNRGLVVWFAAQDSLDIPNRWTISDSVEIRIHFDGSLMFVKTKPGEYMMISVPWELNDYNPVTVLTDELGEYDKTKWRLFWWTNGSYQEFPLGIGFRPGNAFWIITLNAVDLYAGSGTSTELMPSYSINLQQGWNQIANPYSFGNAIDVMQYTPGTIEPTLYGYDGTGYFTANMIMPGEGYWLWANESTSITFDLGLDNSLTRKVIDEPGALSWKGTIAASIGAVKDDGNKFGIAATASEVLDEFDRHEPPVIGKYISLAFDNSDWEDHGDFYCCDIRPEDADGHVWPFVVRTNQEGYVNLNVDWTETMPADWELYLIDVDFGVARDLKDVAEYRFTSTGSEINRHLLMVAGQPSYAREVIEEYEMIPNSYNLFQNFPNPFNAVTTIRFALPEESKITLKIFDILGREINTLVSGDFYGPGAHFILWNGKDDFGQNISTGVYFYWMAANKDGTTRFSEVKKVVLLK